MTSPDIDYDLSGHPGDGFPPPRREVFNPAQMQAYLDTPGGQMLAAMHGSRQAAAAAMVQGETDRRSWRLERAQSLYERFPERFPSVGDAMAHVHDPVGSPMMVIGDSDEIARAARKIDPTRHVRVIEAEPEGDTTFSAYSVAPDGQLSVADTRPPWKR